jgi:hypothetical protein
MVGEDSTGASSSVQSMHAVLTYPPKFLHSLAIFALTLVACIAWLPMGHQNTIGLPLVSTFSYNVMITSLISASRILLEDSSYVLCSTEFWCSHILWVNVQRWSTVFLTHTSPLSLSFSKWQFAETANPQYLLRYPCIAKCQPICSWSAIACHSNSHSDSCTLLTSDMIVSRDSSQDLIHIVNTCWA